MTIDRALYDQLVRITEELAAATDVDHPLIALAAHAARVARDDERPAVFFARNDRQAAMTMYPQCPNDCEHKGHWGATGVVPPAHVLVRYGHGTGFYLGHLRHH